MFTLIMSVLKLQLTFPKSEYVMARSVLLRVSLSEIRVLTVEDAPLSSMLGSEIDIGRNHRSAKKGGDKVDVDNYDTS